jgi:dephospho-CoA kinase
MYVFGLTGGIGSGKSSVSSLLIKKGHTVIDADLLARKALDKDTDAYRRAIEVFGSRVLNEDKTINRQLLADLVFNDAEKRSILNSIVHPEVGRQILIQLDELKDKNIYVFLDIPLLAEQIIKTKNKKGIYNLDAVIVVDCSEEICIKRLVELRNMDKNDVIARMNAQIKRKDRLAIADFIIDNSLDLNYLETQVNNLLKELQLKWPI